MSESTVDCDREHRLDQAIARYLEALRKGIAPTPQELLASQPDLAAELSDFLADLACVERLAAPARAEALPPPTSPGGPPRRFGDYDLLEEIGRGGMGVVWRARQVSLNRTVALKMVLTGHLASAAELERFRQEAQVAGTLDHPNIVPIHEVGEHDGQHFYSMKLVEGTNLAAAIGSRGAAVRREEQRRAAELLATVARAVHHAHQHGILHRDLKPANILIDREGNPHVTDFGLARRLEGSARLTQSGAIAGTPAYMAPEQVTAVKTSSTAVDVYALGALLYECLTGRAPFQADSPWSTLQQVVLQEPAPPRQLNPAIDRDLETICLKCLRKDAQARYGSAEALAGDLDRWLRGEPIRARRVGTGERVLKWVKRRPAVATLVAMVLLLTAAGSGTLAYLRLEAAAARAEQTRERAERATEKEQLARETQEALDRLEDAVAENLLRPVGRTPGDLSPLELSAFHDLANSRNEGVRLRFLEKGLARPETAERLMRRSDIAVHAAVGLNRERRDRVVRLLVDGLRDPQAGPERWQACVLLGVGLETRDATFCRVAASKVLDLIRGSGESQTPPVVVDRLDYLAARMPVEDVAAIAQKVRDALPNEPAPVVRRRLSRALALLAERILGQNVAPDIPEPAEVLEQDFPKVTQPPIPDLVLPPDEPDPVGPAAREKEAGASGRLAGALRTLAEKVSAQEAGAAARKLLDSLAKEQDPEVQGNLAEALAVLAGRMPAGEAETIAAGAVQALLGGVNRQPGRGRHPTLLKPLRELIERIPAKDIASLTEKLLGSLRGKDDAPAGDMLAEAFGVLAERASARDAASIAQKLLDSLTKETSPRIRSSLGRALELFAAKVQAPDATVIVQRLPESLTREKASAVRGCLARALAALAEQVPAQDVTPIAHKLLDPLAKERDPDAGNKLGDGFRALTVKVSAQDAASTAHKLLTVLAKETDADLRRNLTWALAVFTGRVEIQDAGLIVPRLLNFFAKEPDASARGNVAQALTALAPKLPAKDLLLILKHQGCLGQFRRLILDELSARIGPPAPEISALVAGAGAAPAPAGVSAVAVLLAGQFRYPNGRRPFADVWEAVDWIHDHPDLDLSAPPGQSAIWWQPPPLFAPLSLAPEKAPSDPPQLELPPDTPKIMPGTVDAEDLP